MIFGGEIGSVAACATPDARLRAAGARSKGQQQQEQVRRRVRGEGEGRVGSESARWSRGRVATTGQSMSGATGGGSRGRGEGLPTSRKCFFCPAGRGAAGGLAVGEKKATRLHRPDLWRRDRISSLRCCPTRLQSPPNGDSADFKRGSARSSAFGLRCRRTSK